MKWKKSWSVRDLKYLQKIFILSEKNVSSFSISSKYFPACTINMVRLRPYCILLYHVPFRKMVAFMIQHEKGLPFSPADKVKCQCNSAATHQCAKHTWTAFKICSLTPLYKSYLYNMPAFLPTPQIQASTT